jgi:hypothetical protein
MWEPRRLTALRASTACYRDSLAFILTRIRAEWEVQNPEGGQLHLLWDHSARNHSLVCGFLTAIHIQVTVILYVTSCSLVVRHYIIVYLMRAAGLSSGHVTRNGRSRLLRKVGTHLPNCTVSHPPKGLHISCLLSLLNIYNRKTCRNKNTWKT